RQRLEAARIVNQARLEEYVAGRGLLFLILESSAHVTEAEFGVPGGKVDGAAIRERAWENAWMVHEITRWQSEAGRQGAADVAASRYALLQAEIALVREGQARRPARVGGLLKEPNLAKTFDAMTLARARAEVGWAALDDLLRQRLQTARTGYRAQGQEFLVGRERQDATLEWAERLCESELALAGGPADREAAHARHWKRAWQIEAVTRQRYERGRRSVGDAMAARYARLGAEFLWAQTRQ